MEQQPFFVDKTTSCLIQGRMKRRETKSLHELIEFDQFNAEFFCGLVRNKGIIRNHGHIKRTYQFSQFPCFSCLSQWITFLHNASTKVIAASAIACELAPGVMMAEIFRAVEASISTLSYPTPDRPTTFRSVAASMMHAFPMLADYLWKSNSL